VKVRAGGVGVGVVGEGGVCGGARWGVVGVVWRGGMPVRLHVGVEAEVGVVGAVVVVVVVGVVGVGMLVGGPLFFHVVRNYLGSDQKAPYNCTLPAASPSV
jgi:hypothetical protein